jgi:hypothetical protein
MGFSFFGKGEKIEYTGDFRGFAWEGAEMWLRQGFIMAAIAIVLRGDRGLEQLLVMPVWEGRSIAIVLRGDRGLEPSGSGNRYPAKALRSSFGAIEDWNDTT